MTSIEEFRGYPRRAKCYKKKDISPVGPGFGKGHSAEAFFPPIWSAPISAVPFCPQLPGTGNYSSSKGSGRERGRKERDEKQNPLKTTPPKKVFPLEPIRGHCAGTPRAEMLALISRFLAP